MPLDFAAPQVIEALYDDHMGDDLAVINAAKVSYGRRSTLVPRFERFENGQMADQPYMGLSERDERLMYFLARGMTVGDYDKMLAEIEAAARQVTVDADANGDEYFDYAYCRDELADILNRYRDVPLHRSPFNHTSIKITAQAPIWLARQLVKHEYLIWNEVSGRYVEFEPNFYSRNVLHMKVKDKKQGSGMQLHPEAEREALEIMRQAHADAYSAYQRLLSLEVAEEEARGVLPLDTMTTWVWTGSLGAWAKMVKLRMGADAQREARDMAQQVSDIIGLRFPVAWDALMSNGRLPEALRDAA